MDILEAVQKLKEFFPGKYACIKEEISVNHTGRISSTYEGYVDGYDYKSGCKSFEEVITHFTRRLILNRVFPKFVVKKYDSPFCDALNKKL